MDGENRRLQLFFFPFSHSLSFQLDRSRDRRRSRSRDKRRSRSRSGDRRRRSRSRSKSPATTGYDPNAKRRRPTWFDIMPVGGVPPPISDLPGAVQVTPIVPTGPASGAGYAAGGPNQQATRHARRIYVGGLPPSAHEESIASFFSNALAAVGGTTAGPGPCVVNVYINQEKKFAFAEMRTVEEASNAMALDGIMFEGVTVRIRRPADYNPTAAAALGPGAPNPNLNLAAIGMDRAQAQPAAPAGGPPMPPMGTTTQMLPVDAANPGSERIFVGGLPYYLKEPECRELLGSFGQIRAFDLIKDRVTGDSKGYGFVVYDDPSAADVAIAGLHGMKMGDRTLTVRIAEGHQRTAQPVMPAMTMPDGGYQPAMFTAAAPRVVKLVDALKIEELNDDEEYQEIMEDMTEEMSKFGKVIAVHIPRPSKEEGALPPPGLGRVIAEFEDPSVALAARNALHGRKFGGSTVQASLVTEEDFKAGKWD